MGRVAREARRVGRGRKDWLIILRAAFAASVAYMVAGLLWGHQFPFFAPVSAWVALGFSADRHR